MQVVNQLIAALVAIALGAGGSLLILKVVDLLVGVRVVGEHETLGLDLSQHGEEGYNLDVDFVATSLIGHRSSETGFSAAANIVHE